MNPVISCPSRTMLQLCRLFATCAVVVVTSIPAQSHGAHAASQDEDFEALISEFAFAELCVRTTNALKADPTNPHLLYYHGCSQSGLGDYKNACRYYTRAIDLDPQMACAYRERALAARNATHGRITPEIKGDIDAAMRLGAEDVRTLAIRATLYADQGDYENATAVANRAVELGPRDGLSYFARACAYMSRRPRPTTEDAVNAVADAGTAIRLAPKRAEAYLVRAMAQLRLEGGESRAVTDATATIEQGNSCSSAYRTRAQALVRLGRLEEAVADFDRSIALQPDDNPESYYGRAACVFYGMCTNGNFAMAKALIHDLEKVIDEPAIGGEALALIGSILLMCREHADAIAYLDRAIGRINPKYSCILASAYDRRGVAKMALGDSDGAYADFDEARRLCPGEERAVVPEIRQNGAPMTRTINETLGLGLQMVEPDVGAAVR